MQTFQFSKKIVGIALVGTMFLGGIAAFAHGKGMKVQLTAEQQANLENARQSGDTAKVQALLKEYGFTDHFGKNKLSTEQKAQIDAAIKNRDYAAWQKLIPAGSKILTTITADMFERYAQMEEAEQAGDFAKADTIRQELGLPAHKGKGFGEHNAAMAAAITAKDFTAFQAALPKNSPLTGKITADNFARFLEMVAAKKSGDTAKAETIRQELGLPVPPMHQKGKGMMSPELQAAITAKDFTAFQAALPKDSPLVGKITADNFARFLEMVAAQKSGDRAGAQKIATELGFQMMAKGHMGKRYGHGMMGGGQ